MAEDFNIDRIPKQFMDRAFSGWNKDAFFIAFCSGQRVDGFMTTPLQFKLTVEMFNGNIQEYEKKFGVIDTSQLPKVSPLQKKDLK